MSKIHMINRVIESYFIINENMTLIAAKDLMPEFVAAGVFLADVKNGLPIRQILRKLDKENSLHLIPLAFADRKATNVNWYFQRVKSFASTNKDIVPAANQPIRVMPKVMKESDEKYVLDLCDEVLNLKSARQYRFPFLSGDSGRRLPVDSYYPKLHLVIEYRERQHTNAVAFFDKPDKVTVSEVSRGAQRKIYDQRRRDVLPQHKITLIEVSYNDFCCNSRSRIIRDRVRDMHIVETILNPIRNKSN